VLDAINREPSLRLAAQGTANIQSQVPPPASAEDGAEQPADANGQPAADAPIAAAAEKTAGTTSSTK
jgi:hypothetical protein